MRLLLKLRILNNRKHQNFLRNKPQILEEDKTHEIADFVILNNPLKK